MTGFNKWILVNGTTLDFRFTKIVSPGGEKFFVNVVGRQGTIAFFEMKSAGLEHWVIIHPAPEWVLPMQGELNNLITAIERSMKVIPSH